MTMTHQHTHNRRSRFRLVDWALMLVVALAFLLLMFIIASDEIAARIVERQTPTISIFPTPASSADETAEDAARAMETVTLMLDFIQAGSIVLAGVAVVVTGLGVWNNARLREELEEARALDTAFQDVVKRVDRTEISVLDQIGKITTIQSQIETQRDALAEQLRQRMTGMHEDMDSALMLQQQEMESLRDQVQAMLKDMSELQQQISTDLGTARALSAQVIPGLNLTLLAQRQIGMNNLPEALETLRRANDITADNAIIRYFLGDILVRQGMLNEGIRHLEAARLALPDFYDADVSYAYARRIQGDQFKDRPQERDIHYAAAKELFLRVAREHPNLQDISGESVFGALAGLYLREGNLREALRWYEHTRRATPQNSYPINNLALCHFAMGEKDRARQYFQQSLLMARAKLPLVPQDSYVRFDVCTARLGLHCLGVQDYSEAELSDDLNHIAELVEATSISTKPLRTFRSGLERLQPERHPRVAKAIELLQGHINRLDEIFSG